MPSHMKAIEQTYISLLADVSRLSGFSEIRGSCSELRWCINDAPKLEKQFLGAIESGSEIPIDSFPKELRRLALGAVTDPILMRYLRQLLLFCYKAHVPHTDEQIKQTINSFIDTNHRVGNWGNNLSVVQPCLLDEARRQCQSVLYRFSLKECSAPHHGPGSVTTSKQRWEHRYSTIEPVYPFSDFFCLSLNRDMHEAWDDAVCHDHIHAKLIAVPKDSRGPRLICVHPAEAIWVQQFARHGLERAISLRRYQPGPWPSGRIWFDDQTVNGRIALTSSLSKHYATIDMKEASDRISDLLVQILFGSKYKYFGCSRAQKIRIGSQIIDYHAYAPMGNATTFPVQSLVFWSICVASLRRRGFCQPGAAFVFGDDIVIPSEAAETVVNDLESFGLVVNRTKSFWRSNFRESCGVDAYHGVNVTPVRWKMAVNARTRQDMQSLSDLAMRLRIAGYEDSARTAYDILRARLKHHGRRLFYTDNPKHGGLAEYTSDSCKAWSNAYWRKHVQLYVTPVCRIEEQRHKPVLHGWNHVLESVCSLERTYRSNVPDRDGSRRLVLKRGWMPVNGF